MATADSVEGDVARLGMAIADLLDEVDAPARLSDANLVEQLSFLQLRENFRAFLEFFASKRDVPAAHLARALFEESSSCNP